MYAQLGLLFVRTVAVVAVVVVQFEKHTKVTLGTFLNSLTDLFVFSSMPEVFINFPHSLSQIGPLSVCLSYTLSLIYPFSLSLSFNLSYYPFIKLSLSY